MHKSSHFIRSRRQLIWLLLVVTLLLIAGIFVYSYLSRDKSPIPSQLRSQLTFSPFVIPKNSQNYSTSDYKFSLAENKVQILSYVIRTKDAAISLSQYPQPQEFTDIPEYKERFLSNVTKQYETVQTANGTIYLGRQTKQNNKQLAVMIERGLLVLMSPDKELNPAQWRTLGDNLELQKVLN